MQVNSVSSAQSFGTQGANYVPFVQWVATADDRDLKTMAYNMAKHQVDDKKHRRIDNLLYYSVPLAGALSYATAPGLSRIGRLATGAKVGALFTLPFLAVDAAFGIQRSINKHSSTAETFSTKHPILSNIGSIAAGLAATVAIRGAASKFAAKYGAQIAAKAAPAVEKLTNKLDASKILNYASKSIEKAPSALKDMAKVALNWSPYALLGIMIGHEINHTNVKYQQHYKNYTNLKLAQNEIRQRISQAAEQA